MTTAPTTTITAQPAALTDYALSAQDTLKQAHLIQQVMREVMKDGEHYGVIPGTEKRDRDGNVTAGKKSLLKPGAEKLCFVFGLSNKLEIQVDNLAGGHREYRILCNLFDRGGNLRGQGVGSASTMESKHRYRGSAGKACPTCGAMAIRASKAEYGGGYYCDSNKGGCGWKTKANTPEAKALDKLPTLRAENPDPADQYNTVLKMAKKRALVDAVLTATAASDIFAQDLEDLEDKIDDEPAPPPKAQEARTAGPAQDGTPATTQGQATSKPVPPKPAAAPHIEAARALWAALNKTQKDSGKPVLDRLCKLHRAPTPAEIAPADVEAFVADVAELTKEAGDLARVEDLLSGWERQAQEGT